MANQLKTTSFMVSLKIGLYVVEENGGNSDDEWFATVTLHPDDVRGGAARILDGEKGMQAILEQGHDQIVINVRQPSVAVYITEYGRGAKRDDLRRVNVKAIDTRKTRPARTRPATPKIEDAVVADISDSSAVGVSVLAHLDGVGETTFENGQWVGAGAANIDGFSLSLMSPPEDLEIEYRCGNEIIGLTDWTSAGKFCGSRGKGILLTSFAARLTGTASNLYTIRYKCRFGDAEVSPVCRNGEVCASVTNAPLRSLVLEIVDTEADKSDRIVVADTIPGSFDEQAYLTANPDVAAAVALNEMTSGYDHYKRFGEAEGRPLLDHG